jgi:hypothetical protein
VLLILIHGDGEDLFRLPSSETKLENETHKNINLPGKAVFVGVIEAFSGRRSTLFSTLDKGEWSVSEPIRFDVG